MIARKEKFNELYEKAIAEWPDELELIIEKEGFLDASVSPDGYELLKCKTTEWDGDKENYVVKNLYNICEEIVDKYLGENEEVIWVHLHEAIKILVHDMAFFIKRVRVEDIRQKSIKKEFEEKIKEIEKDPSLGGWTGKDLKYIKEYFEELL